MKKTAALLLTVTMTMAMAFAGCGDASEDANTKNTDAENKANTENEEDLQGDYEGDGPLVDGVLNVGTNAEFPPFEYVGDDGEPDGFDMALIKAIGEKMGVEVVVENMEFDSLVSSIGSKIDVAIAGMTVTEERKNMVDFSNSYYEAVQYVIVPADSEIASMADLEGKTIGVQLGTTGDFIVEDDIEGATPAQYNKGVDAVNDLINGRVDAVIIDKNPAMVFAEKFQDEVKVIDGADFEFEPENYAIALPKGDEALLNAINEALEEVIADGTFDELIIRYIEN